MNDYMIKDIILNSYKKPRGVKIIYVTQTMSNLEYVFST